MNKIIIEVGSTCTKVDGYNGNSIKRIKEMVIQFKNNYIEKNELNKNDIDKLVNLVNEYKEAEIFVCGTSIFRNLPEIQKNKFLNEFKNRTGVDFKIISSEEENIYTVKGCTKNVKKAVVFVGGGGSTEISYWDNNSIIEMKNNPFGAIDILKQFPDLSSDIALSNLEDVIQYIQERIEIPDVKTDIMILAGGGHEKFARESGIKYENNTLYSDISAPIMMDIITRETETNRYYTNISLDSIKNNSEDPNWWNATRVMCAFVLAVARKIDAKYIIPTNISMAYGIV